MENTAILYSYFRSSCSWRVRIVLALKGIQYETKAVNLLTEDNNSEWFLKINPMGQVPALVIDGLTLLQSTAILEYLDETRPVPNLLPEGNAALRATVRAICEVINSGIQPLQNIGGLEALEKERRAVQAKKVITVGFDALETLLKKTSGKYCVGDTVTLADCYLIPQVYNAKRNEVELTKYPIISDIVRQLETIPAFQVSHPSKQPDCPPELRN